MSVEVAAPAGAQVDALLPSTKASTVQVQAVAAAAAAGAVPAAASTEVVGGDGSEASDAGEAALQSLAQRSSYYYAHTQRGEDAAPFQPPQKIDAGSVPVAAAAGAEPAGASKWNTGSYHWEETDLKPAFAQLLAQHAGVVRVDAGKVVLQCTRVQCDGDIFSNLRKGKLILAYDLTLTVHFAATFTRGAGHDPVHFRGTLVVGNVCEDHAPAEWQLRDPAVEEVPAEDTVTPDIMVPEPGLRGAGSNKRVMTATEMDRSIRQQRLVKKHVGKAFLKAVVSAVDAALKEQREQETKRQLGKQKRR